MSLFSVLGLGACNRDNMVYAYEQDIWMVWQKNYQ